MEWYPDAIRMSARYYNIGRHFGRVWPDTVDTIVEHHTDGAWEGAVRTLRGETTRQASAHFLVGRDGRIVQFVSLADIAWHAGNWEVNVRSVGIEHEHYKIGDRYVGWTEEQLNASAALHRWLFAQMKNPPRIVRHRDVASTTCPMDLPVEEIIRRAQRGTPQQQTQTTISFDNWPYFIGGGFAEFWKQRGVLKIFGLPLSNEYEMEIDGKKVVVQDFERARFEHRPDIGRPEDWHVVLGRVNAERLALAEELQAARGELDRVHALLREICERICRGDAA